MTIAYVDRTLTDHTTVSTTHPETTTMTTSTKTARKKRTAKGDRPTDISPTTTDVVTPATDQAVDESPPTAVEDTPPTPPIAQTAVDEAPATPPADVTPAVQDLAARIVTCGADVATKVQFLKDLVRQDDAAIAAAIEAEIIRIGPATRPARKTGNGSVPVVCSHCDKHFLGRPSQQECRVCSDYAKAHGGQKRPLHGTKTPKAPVIPPPAATDTAASTKKKRSTKRETHRLH